MTWINGLQPCNEWRIVIYIQTDEKIRINKLLLWLYRSLIEGNDKKQAKYYIEKGKNNRRDS